MKENGLSGSFLALLELVRLNRVKIEQPVNYADIYISISPEQLIEQNNWEVSA